MWIGVAWNENVKGRRNVQVILRDDDENVIDSRIIRTEVLAGESAHTKQRLKRMYRREEGVNPSCHFQKKQPQHLEILSVAYDMPTLRLNFRRWSSFKHGTS